MVNPEDTFFSVKRFIGSKYDEVQEESRQVPYQVNKDSTGNVKLHSNHASKDFAPEEISAVVLRKLVDDAGASPACMPALPHSVSCECDSECCCMATMHRLQRCIAVA